MKISAKFEKMESEQVLLGDITKEPTAQNKFRGGYSVAKRQICPANAEMLWSLNPMTEGRNENCY